MKPANYMMLCENTSNHHTITRDWLDFYFSLDFWEKYCTHYYYATLAGIPI